jgi:hypothetical protein
VGFSLRDQWIHEPLEHRIAEARAAAQDDYAEELAMGASADEAHPSPSETRGATLGTGLAARHVTGGLPDVGARSHSHNPLEDAS